MPSVVKATAIVNGDVITQTDIDQRLALLAIANGGQIPADEIERLRQQVLRNLIDETLQIQAAKTEKIEIKQSDIDKTVARVAANVKQTPDAARRLSSRPTARRSSRCAARSRARSPGSGCSAPRSKAASASATTKSRPCSTSSTRPRAPRNITSARSSCPRRPTTEAQTLANANKILEQLQQRRLLRRLCAAIFRSLDRGGRRRPRLGPPRAAARRRSPTALRADAAGHGQQPDPGPGRRFDHRRPGHAQDPDRRPARRGAQPQAGLDQLPQGHHAAAGRADRRALRRGGAQRRRLRRRREDRRRLPRRGRPERPGSRCATCRRRCSR